MAVVISSEENSYFASSSLQRSHSGKFTPPGPSYSSSPSSSSHQRTSYNKSALPNSRRHRSPSSSPTISHDDSAAPSLASTPPSSISLDTQCDQDDDKILFPSYDDVSYYGQVEDLESPVSPRGTGDSYTVSSTSESTSTDASRPVSPEPYVQEHADDDTAVRTQPSRHVDYLSHCWKEEDIWSSWKHIVSKRGAYSNSARLENASWRTWMKAKNKLKTVSPETLNWLKDCDVTWLYGPLQTASDQALKLTTSSPVCSSRISKSNSFLHKKPILKKRSMSEIMLQRSLSASSLLKQAAAAVQAQQSGERRTDRPLMGRIQSDYAAFPFSSTRMSRQNSSVLPSVSSSGIASPGTGEKKHIHFNEQVEQCIALEMKGEEDEELGYAIAEEYDSDSDDGAIMMKRSNSTRKLPQLGRKSSSRNSFSGESKTIAMLPSTTLKYREDTPEPNETAMKHSNGFWNSSKLSPSPSQETLRPSKPSTRILLAEDEDDADLNWQPTVYTRMEGIGSTQDRHDSGSGSNSPSPAGEPSGMRRTPSGMFMPYEGDEDDIVSEGLFGKVVDTVNTARDIAHVIWNVGWRR